MPIVVALHGLDEIRIQWLYEDEEDDVVWYSRYKGRDISSESLISEGVRCPPE